MQSTWACWALAVQGLQKACAGGPTGLCAAARPLGAAPMFRWTRVSGGRYRPATGGMLDDTTSSARQGAIVVLASGGVESAALLAYYQHWSHGQELLPLFVDYGQRNAQQQEAAQQRMCRHLGLTCAALKAPNLAHRLTLAKHSEHRHHAPPPHRNLLLLSLAASFAADNDSCNVAICLNKDDLGTGSAASLPFLRRVEALYADLEPPLQLLMPLLGLTKEQVVKMGSQVEAPWHLAYSCDEGGEQPCGTCGPCTRRATAFRAAGVAAPLAA